MKTITYSLLVGCVLLVGCATKAETGALAAGGLGAATGEVIGGGRGALIGGVASAVVGGIVGSSLDEQDRQLMEKRSPRTVERMDRGEPFTVNDVIKLSQGGVSDKTIISYMGETRTRYNLSQAQIKRMQDAGVSQRVINYMINTGR